MRQVGAAVMSFFSVRQASDLLLLLFLKFSLIPSFLSCRLDLLFGGRVKRSADERAQLSINHLFLLRLLL